MRPVGADAGDYAVPTPEPVSALVLALVKAGAAQCEHASTPVVSEEPGTEGVGRTASAESAAVGHGSGGASAATISAGACLNLVLGGRGLCWKHAGGDAASAV